MKTHLPLRTGLAGLALMLGATFAPVALASTSEAPASVAADSAAAIAAYPLTTCVVSGEKLGDGDMGAPINHVYKEEGKPDRLVRFCCKPCVKKFNQEPAKYLKLIDATAAKACCAAPAAPAAKGCCASPADGADQTVHSSH